ncbi:MAG: 16S rRNA (guanine(966)-N(2))-methyltransferase RsmD [Flavobacteriales bacterium]|jgi:16S rRNA (guanine(966)-N(2))-methyltransferase RsmD|nr:16S rRNA (guanine(966)-N(2))-methyltransferase RsmD [Flavobacteriales bacterium]
MRIIRGKYKGKRILAPKNIKARPTTDFAKEALFNVLENSYDFDGLEVLDLFAGIGSISLEFASRGAQKVDAVDIALQSIKFISKISEELALPVRAFKYNAFTYLTKPHHQYDIIFADPPYGMDNLNKIPELVFENKMLTANGILIVEHDQRTDLSSHPSYVNTRSYGKVNFSFFE